jgi:hypothetical protein
MEERLLPGQKKIWGPVPSLSLPLPRDGPPRSLQAMTHCWLEKWLLADTAAYALSACVRNLANRVATDTESLLRPSTRCT